MVKSIFNYFFKSNKMLRKKINYLWKITRSPKKNFHMTKNWRKKSRLLWFLFRLSSYDRKEFTANLYFTSLGEYWFIACVFYIKGREVRQKPSEQWFFSSVFYSIKKFLKTAYDFSKNNLFYFLTFYWV